MYQRKNPRLDYTCDLCRLCWYNGVALDSAVVTVGQINGGYNYNIIADRVDLTGTVRTLLPNTRVREAGIPSAVMCMSQNSIWRHRHWCRSECKRSAQEW